MQQSGVLPTVTLQYQRIVKFRVESHPLSQAFAGKRARLGTLNEKIPNHDFPEGSSSLTTDLWKGKVSFLLPWGLHLSSSLPKCGDRHGRYPRGGNKALSRETVQYSGSVPQLTAAQQINYCFEDHTAGKFRATFSPRPCRERVCSSWEEDKGALLPCSFSPASTEDTGISQDPWEGVQVPLFKNKVLSSNKKLSKKASKTEFWMGGLQNKSELQRKRDTQVGAGITEHLLLDKTHPSLSQRAPLTSF